GHCHTKVVAAIRDQITKLIHVPNNFYHLQQAKLAKEIIRNAFPGKVFFCNSGTEGVEAAIKPARAYGKDSRYEIITMEKSFHGRTLGSLAATGQLKYKDGFHPLPAGFNMVPFNDITALKNAINEKTVAVMLELIQGEGGVNIIEKKYLKELREICEKKDILLIFDEVQTGMGRTGEIFAFKHFGIKPDIMVLAKALGGGLPIGALVVKNDIADTFKPGMHASTFGGNPLACKAALGTFTAIFQEKMLKNSREMGKYLLKELEKLKRKHSCILAIRGIGLMIGIELKMDGKSVYDECLENGLIINCTQGTILRIMPALNVTKKQADKAIHILDKSLENITKVG
ncbi:MAG: aspartate aminotransferase family protein, partial [Candidatus Omnitrophica bacterium]|nr:aspartate aminotransferase family protein [Candidatus Omnitrophota bacterium]